MADKQTTLAKSEKQDTPAIRYRRTVETMAANELTNLMGDEEGRKAAASFALAFRQAALQTPKLYQCSQESVGQALAMCLLTKLMPGGPTPLVWLIPRKIKDVLTLQWMASTKGLQVLAKRAQYRVRVGAVYDGDHFHFMDGVKMELEHVPAEPRKNEDEEAFRGCWVVASEITPGQPDQLAGIAFMSKEKINKRRAASDSYKAWLSKKKSCPWVEWYEEMCLKTAVRYAVNRGLVMLDEVGRAAYDHELKQEKGEAIEDEESPTKGLQVLLAERAGALKDAEPETVEAELVEDDKPTEPKGEPTMCQACGKNTVEADQDLCESCDEEAGKGHGDG